MKLSSRLRWMLAVGTLCLALWPAAAPGQKYGIRTREETKRVADAVKGVLGMDGKRGDRLYVVSTPFARSELRVRAERRRKQAARNQLMMQVALNVSKGIAIVLVLLVLRAVTNAIGRGVAREEQMALTAQQELAEAAEEALPETPHEVLLGRIAGLIVDRPEESARVIQTMLMEDRQRQTV